MRALKILILEDHSFQLMALHQMLNRQEVFDVLTAENVEAAQRSLGKRGSIDIAICDLHMTGDDGFEMIRHLGRHHEARAIIILSSAEQAVIDRAVSQAEQQGLWVLGGLQKPLTPNALRALLARYHELEEQRHGLVGSRQLPACALLASPLQYCVAYYQPVLSPGGDLLRVDALPRWRYCAGVTVAPQSMLASIEYAGLSAALSWHLLELAFTASARFSAQSGRALPVGVSVSPAWLKEPRLIERLCELLERSGIAADLVTLQVQDIALLSPQQRRESLERLHRLGCRLALGDFGCTAISLQGLLELPFCELIIAAPADDACQAAVLAAGTGVAAQMGMSVVTSNVQRFPERPPACTQGAICGEPMSYALLQTWISERGAA